MTALANLDDTLAPPADAVPLLNSRRNGRSALGIVGGRLTSTKIDRLENLISTVNVLALVGGVANSFLFASGLGVGKSACEPELADWARDFLAIARERGCDVILPVDLVVVRRFEAGAAHEVAPATACPPDSIIMDCGPATIDMLWKLMRSTEAAYWHGPVGVVELPPFNAGTAAVARRLARLASEKRIESFASGQDTVAAIEKIGLTRDFTETSVTGWPVVPVSPPRVAQASA